MEGRIVLGFRIGRFQLFEGRHQGLWNVAASIRAEPSGAEGLSNFKRAAQILTSKEKAATLFVAASWISCSLNLCCLSCQKDVTPPEPLLGDQ